MSHDYKSDLHEAHEKLAALFKQKDELEIEIAKQQRRAAALALLCEDSGEAVEALELNLGGLSDAVRSVLRAAGPYGLTPAEVKKNLSQLHFPVDKYKNFRGSLHTVLKRLIDAKEVKRAIHDFPEGKDESVYQWVGKIRSRF
jgi:hypothetical protein